jgi:hypothetical protein
LGFNGFSFSFLPHVHCGSALIFVFASDWAMSQYIFGNYLTRLLIDGGIIKAWICYGELRMMHWLLKLIRDEGGTLHFSATMPFHFPDTRVGVLLAILQ